MNGGKGCYDGCGCPKGPKGSIGWSGGTNFPKWAIDILQFRNKRLNDDYIISGYKFDEVEIQYIEIDNALNEMIKFIESHEENR
jgi:hypothetical protein